MKYILYVKCSHDEHGEQGKALKDRIALLHKIRDEVPLYVVSKAIDTAPKHRSPDRATFASALGQIEEGKPDGILALGVENLSRNVVDGGKLLELVKQGKLKSIWTKSGELLDRRLLV